MKLIQAMPDKLTGSSRNSATIETPTDYLQSADSFIFGTEYLYGLHNHIVETDNASNVDIIWSGDSTTFNNGGLAGGSPSEIATLYSIAKGVGFATHINQGQSSKTAVDWDTTQVDIDITAYPDMRVYIARWGINDGAQNIPVQTSLAAVESALGKLRAFKDVDDLSIVLMTPTSASRLETNLNYEWTEQFNAGLRKMARKYRATFFDTYALLGDSLNSGGKWTDDPFGNGWGVHPVTAINYTITQKVCDMLFDPLLASYKTLNNTTMVFPTARYNPTPSSPPGNFPKGTSHWGAKTSAGWPAAGHIEVTRVDDFAKQAITYVDGNGVPTGTPRAVRHGLASTNVWSKWYNFTVTPSLLNGWKAGSKPPKYIHREDGSCMLMGIVIHNNAGLQDAPFMNLPPEMRPSGDRIFTPWTSASQSPRLVISQNGDVRAYLENSDSGCYIDGVCWQAGA